MRTIVFPAKLNDSGSIVTVLHGALGLLGFEVDDDEMRQGVFGRKSEALIKAIQKNLGAPRPSGEVNQELAVTLNKLVSGKEPIGAIGKDGDLTKALGANDALTKALGTDGALTKALGKDGDLAKAVGVEGVLTKALSRAVVEKHGPTEEACAGSTSHKARTTRLAVRRHRP